MLISKNGIDFIKSFEGLRLTAYQCQAGIWTIGYGHTRNVKQGDVITKEQAEELLKSDICPIAQLLEKWLKKNQIELEQNEYDAVFSLVFNIGMNNFIGSSVAKYIIQRREKVTIANAFLLWNKIRKNGNLVISNGLVIRRKKERALFLDNNYN